MSSNWSTALPTLHLEVRPSRCLAAALGLIGLLGAAGLFLSNLPTAAAIALAPLVAGWGLASAVHASRAPILDFAFGGDGNVRIGGQTVEDVRLDWRGPLTRIDWQAGGKRRRFVAWPDAIPAARRRELRLWRLAHRADVSTRPVAP